MIMMDFRLAPFNIFRKSSRKCGETEESATTVSEAKISSRACIVNRLTLPRAIKRGNFKYLSKRSPTESSPTLTVLPGDKDDAPLPIADEREVDVEANDNSNAINETLAAYENRLPDKEEDARLEPVFPDLYYSYVIQLATGS
jgi:hypothetical protein